MKLSQTAQQPQPKTENSIPMSSSENPKLEESKPEIEILEQSPKPTETEQDQEGEEEEEEEEEEGECPFCQYMKAGGCKEAFVEWEKCVDEGEKNKEDIVNKCFEATAALQKCMQAFPDHYGPILEAEKAAEQQAIDELEKELEHREKKSASATPASGNQEEKSESS